MSGLRRRCVREMMLDRRELRDVWDAVDTRSRLGAGDGSRIDGGDCTTLDPVAHLFSSGSGDIECSWWSSVERNGGVESRWDNDFVLGGGDEIRCDSCSFCRVIDRSKVVVIGKAGDACDVEGVVDLDLRRRGRRARERVFVMWCGSQSFLLGLPCESS